MNDSSPSSQIARPRQPAWNKGKLTGPKPPLRPGTCGRSGPSCNWSPARATWPCSILRSTASCVVATSWRSVWMMWRPTGTRSTELLSARGNGSAGPLRADRGDTPSAGRLPTRERPESRAILVPGPARVRSVADDAPICSAGLPMDQR